MKSPQSIVPPTTSTPESLARLSEVLHSARVVVTVGSGGVGKTTTAAALAIAAARAGRRAAVLTIDPARRLAQALGLSELGNTPRPLPDELVAPGAVDAMMLETAAAFDDLITRLVPDPERRERLLANRLYQVIARHLGGTHEYMAVERLFELTRNGKYDLVVLDTPPSVNALDFLDAPQRLIHFFSDKVTRFFVKRSEDAKKGLFARLRDRAGELALSILGKAFGEGFMEEVQDFTTAFQGLFVAFRERGMVVDALLRSRETSFLVITAADPVRVTEALEFSAALTRLGIRPHSFVVNRVHLRRNQEDPPLTPSDVAHAMSATEEPPPDLDRLVLELNDAVRLCQSLASRDQQGLSQLERASGKDRLIVVPELATEVGDRNAVEHLLEALTTPSETR